MLHRRRGYQERAGGPENTVSVDDTARYAGTPAEHAAREALEAGAEALWRCMHPYTTRRLPDEFRDDYMQRAEVVVLAVSGHGR